MKSIAVIGTLDTKGEEHAYVAELIRARGHRPVLIDVGSLAPPSVQPDVSRTEIASAAGINFEELTVDKDRGKCVTAMSEAAAQYLGALVNAGKIHGVISLGGGGGTAISTRAMRALPIGFPKVMVSTLAAGNVAPYVGTKDIVMMPSIVDISGLNRLSRVLLARAAGAICGMVEIEVPQVEEKPLIVASMFGNTTACVNHAKAQLEQAGYEVLVFAATGMGGRIMDSLIESGMIDGVLDITTTEWADELVGGVLNAGPQRLEATGKAGVPSIVSLGCLDMVNFGEPQTVPGKFKDRNFYHHNPQVTLMRTDKEENLQLGKILASKINAYTGPVTVLIPTQALSVVSAPGGPFHDIEADQALFDSLKSHLEPKIKVLELHEEINTPAFAEACVSELLANIKSAK